MADPLSEIEQIRARAEAAQVGPWHWEPYDDSTVGVWFGTRFSEPFAYLDETNEAEAVFIAHARTDIPLLLAALSAYEDKFNAMDDDVRRVYAKRDAALARLEALEGAAREMLKPFSDQLRARVALAAAIEAERG